MRVGRYLAIGAVVLAGAIIVASVRTSLDRPSAPRVAPRGQGAQGVPQRPRVAVQDRAPSAVFAEPRTQRDTTTAANAAGHTVGYETTISRNAVSSLAGASISLPQTYRIVITMLGWQARSVACIRIESAAFCPEVSSRDGASRAETPGAAGLSERLLELTVLATVSPRVTDLRAGQTRSGMLVLLPNATSPTFFLDRLNE